MSAKTWDRIFLSVCIITFVTSVISETFCLYSFKILDQGKFFCLTLIISIPILLLATALVYWIRKIFSVSVNTGSTFDISQFFFTFGVGIIPLVFSGGILLNTLLDKSPVQKIDQIIDGKYTSSNLGSSKISTYTVLIPPWRHGRERYRLNVSEDQYKNVTPYLSHVIIKTRPGYLGFEWISLKSNT